MNRPQPTGLRDSWWILEGAQRVRVDAFERARDGACERAGVDRITPIERDAHGDATWYEAIGERRSVMLARGDAYLAWVQRTGTAFDIVQARKDGAA